MRFQVSEVVLLMVRVIWYVTSCCWVSTGTVRSRCQEIL